MDTSRPRIALLALILAMAAAPALALDPVNTTFFGSVAIEGYDPVAYFTEGKPVKGNKKHSLEYEGANWRFASAENRALFEADPQKYAPQYGGYCAWAVSQGYTAGIEPEAWTIHEGKLYLNYSKKVRAQWLEKRDALIEAGDENWPRLLAE